MQNLLAKHDTYQNMIICVWLPQMKQLSPPIIYINTLKKQNKKKIESLIRPRQNFHYTIIPVQGFIT